MRYTYIYPKICSLWTVCPCFFLPLCFYTMEAQNTVRTLDVNLVIRSVQGSC